MVEQGVTSVCNFVQRWLNIPELQSHCIQNNCSMRNSIVTKQSLEKLIRISINR